MKLLAVSVVYLTLAMSVTSADFQSACKAVELGSRVECGYPGITADACRAQLCCYDDTLVGVWCFKAPADFQSVCMAVEVDSREECGYSGITAAECRAQVCCFDDTRVGKWCFKSPEDVDACASSPCLNGGQCTDGVYSFSCVCPEGYNGTYCETYDPCAPNPCQNGGQCVPSGTLHICVCPDGFSGSNCETDIDECSSNPCKNGSWCEDTINAYICNCMPGLTGTDCDVDLDECRSNPCKNGGTCINGVNNFTCICPEGYVDDNCQSLCEPVLVQHNIDGSNFFDRTWEEFKVGFGNKSGNYWIGNEELHQRTKNNTYKLRFDLQSADNGQWYWAEYTTFVVDDECHEYMLHVGGFSGNVIQDAVAGSHSLDGMRFTTKDRDNDEYYSYNCAVTNGGGFWYRGCTYCDVNANSDMDNGFRWVYLYSNYYDLYVSRMSLLCR